MKKAIQVRLDQDDYDKLSHIAEQLACPHGAVLRMLLRQFPGTTIDPLKPDVAPSEGGRHGRS